MRLKLAALIAGIALAVVSLGSAEPAEAASSGGYVVNMGYAPVKAVSVFGNTLTLYHGQSASYISKAYAGCKRIETIRPSFTPIGYGWYRPSSDAFIRLWDYPC